MTRNEKKMKKKNKQTLDGKGLREDEREKIKSPMQARQRKRT